MNAKQPPLCRVHWAIYQLRNDPNAAYMLCCNDEEWKRGRWDECLHEALTVGRADDLLTVGPAIQRVKLGKYRDEHNATVVFCGCSRLVVEGRPRP